MSEYCALCGTEARHAAGIGPFCPNRKCKNSDGPMIDSPEKAKNRQPVTAREDQAGIRTPREMAMGKPERNYSAITPKAEAQGAAPQTCSCSGKDAAVCRSMPQHQPEYCRVKGAQSPQDAHSEKAFTLHCRCGSDFKPECPDCHTLYQETYSVEAARSTPSPDPNAKCPTCGSESERYIGIKLRTGVRVECPDPWHATPDSPPQIVSAIEQFNQNFVPDPNDSAPRYVQVIREYASSSNAAPKEESCEECGSTCRITAGADNLVCYHCWLEECLKKVEAKVQDEQKAHETIAHYLIALVGTADGTSVSAAERAAAEIEDLRSERDGLREALREIKRGAPEEKDFALGGKYDYGEDCGNSGDVRELGSAEEHFRIAKLARAALNDSGARLGTESTESPLGCVGSL